MLDTLYRRQFLVAALLVALTACGGGDAADSADGAADQSAEPADMGTPAVVASAEGEELYATCVACHQVNGQGMPGAFPPLAGSEWVTGSPDRLIAILLHGMQGPVTVAGVEYNGVMLPYGVGVPISDDQLATLLTYVRTSWGNSASAITVADIERVKAATSDRTTAWTADELMAAMP